jgi:methionine sulfoxide reductase catalytic subunit
MNIIKPQSWNLKERLVTPEADYFNRRKFLKAAGLTALGSQALLANASSIPTLQSNKNSLYQSLKPTGMTRVTTYNNFYEFSMQKTAPHKIANSLKTEDWTITIDGLVEKPITIDINALIKKMSIEERIYRFRCVEGWSMVVPWNGFSLASLIKQALPLSKAKYVRFETKFDPESFPQQKDASLFNIPFPYVEGLRLDEAMNPLVFLSVGLYGKILPKQNGAPIRLVLPWKYGFKSIKSINRITLTDTQPINTWHKLAPKEYGFYANVNPNVSHPRWSQAKERPLGDFFKQKTLMFNGYENEVGHLYKNMDLTKLI